MMRGKKRRKSRKKRQKRQQKKKKKKKKTNLTVRGSYSLVCLIVFPAKERATISYEAHRHHPAKVHGQISRPSLPGRSVTWLSLTDANGEWSNHLATWEIWVLSGLTEQLPKLALRTCDFDPHIFFPHWPEGDFHWGQLEPGNLWKCFCVFRMQFCRTRNPFSIISAVRASPLQSAGVATCWLPAHGASWVTVCSFNIRESAGLSQQRKCFLGFYASGSPLVYEHLDNACLVVEKEICREFRPFSRAVAWLTQ